MEQLIYVLVESVYTYFFAVQLCMMARVICSIFILDEDSKIMNFLYCATEPLVYPIRLLFQKFGFSDDFILDLPFMATMLVIILVQSVLPTVYI